MGDSYQKMLKEIKARFLINYELAVLLVPEKLRPEFEQKIIRRQDLEEDLIPLIASAREFGVEETAGMVRDWLQGRLGLAGFDRRLRLNGVYPEEIYAELTRGVFND